MAYKNWFLPVSILVYLVFLLLGLGSFPLIDWDENIYGAASKSMWQTGEFFRIRVNGEDFSEKPPFYFWTTNLFYFLLGPSEFATRLPSVFSGVVSFLALFYFGRYLKSASFGLSWALIYSSSLLPLALARTAYIDHLFNTCILLTIISLYLYNEREGRSFSERAPWILASASFGGIAVLTKGPLGLGIPVLVLILNRIWERRFKQNLSDAFLFGLASLLVLSSYYLTNYLIYGDGFLVQFFDFQRKLLTQSLESHTGPFYYHIVAGLIGFFPWTIFLFYIPKSWKSLATNNLGRISRYFLLWILLVLAIFSVVKTKLPHYSSSIYLGLSFFSAFLFTEKENEASKKTVGIATALFGLVFGGLFSLLPFLVPTMATGFGYSMGELPNFGLLDSLPGLLILAGFGAGSFLYFQKEEGTGLKFRFTLWASMLLFFSSISYSLVPKILHFLQDGNLRLYDRAAESKGKIVYYKYLSFYPMFYRSEKISMIGSYKFQDRSSLLLSQEKLAIICNENSILELVLSYPDRKFETIEKEKGLVLLFSSPK